MGLVFSGEVRRGLCKGSLMFTAKAFLRPKLCSYLLGCETCSCDCEEGGGGGGHKQLA